MFSPLALTQTLPFLPLAQGDIDYQVDRRGEEGLIDTLLAEPTTKVILVRGGLVAVPRGQGGLVDYENVHMRLATLPGAYVGAELSRYPQAVAMFLGVYGGARAEHVVAVDITRIPADDPADAVPDAAGVGVDDAFDADARQEYADASARKRESLLRRAVRQFDWVDLRGFAPHANAREAGQATSAVTLGMWHMSQRFCPTCGASVATALAGWAQRCTAKDDGRILFPRIEPAVITAIVDGQDRLLVQHNAAWRNPTLYSVSAGFVEAGENLEHAVRREAKEETGITLGEVRYLGSQPWPFPASLMMAFKAQALTGDVRVDGDETVAARWVTRDEYTQELISGRMSAPGRATIARYMIEEWYGREL